MLSYQGGAERVPMPTFGLVTAMPEEFHAMRALLDDPVHIRVMRDRADYIVGELPSLDGRLPHEVVLTLTADIGTHATADACKGMAMSFPTVNVLIMAGIAAGVPAPDSPDRHVRLGDIVVATWGIVDYDHVVRGAGGEELRQPFPRPADLLARADRMLQAAEHADRRPWEQWLEVTGNPLLTGFDRPHGSADVLRDGADPGRVIAHPPRLLSGHRRDMPKVHRGMIGSANVSLRCSAERDALASRYGLLAFEMEGAGIGTCSFVNGLDWFMVRGISDYADENLGTRWRRYAALAAAAYVRALLEATPPTGPRGGHPLADGSMSAAANRGLAASAPWRAASSASVDARK